MARRKAAVLYVRPLFGEGIARLLETDERLHVVAVDARLSHARDQLRALHPDVVVVEEGGRTDEILEVFRELPRALVITVNLAGNTMNIYRNWEVVGANFEDLKTAVHGRPRRRPAEVTPPDRSAGQG